MALLEMGKNHVCLLNLGCSNLELVVSWNARRSCRSGDQEVPIPLSSLLKIVLWDNILQGDSRAQFW